MAIGEAGYIGAAIIAASAAYFGLVLGKEQKTTESRQQWINDQRADIATILSIAVRAVDAKDKTILRQKFDDAHGRIELRENPTKQEWKFVLQEISAIRHYAFDTPMISCVIVSKDTVIRLSRDLLKKEWDRVRNGEPWFTIAKFLLPPIIALAVGGLAYGQGYIKIYTSMANETVAKNCSQKSPVR